MFKVIATVELSDHDDIDPFESTPIAVISKILTSVDNNGSGASTVLTDNVVPRMDEGSSSEHHNESQNGASSVSTNTVTLAMDGHLPSDHHNEDLDDVFNSNMNAMAVANIPTMTTIHQNDFEFEQSMADGSIQVETENGQVPYDGDNGIPQANHKHPMYWLQPAQ